MPRLVLSLLLVFGWLALSHADYRPEVLEIGLKTSEAASRMDREALEQLTAGIVKSRGELDADSYGTLLSNAAQSWDRYAAKDGTAISNAYHMRRIAREAQLDVGFNDNTTVTQFERVRWRPELYSPTMDERSFAVARQEETDLWLRYWRKLEDAHMTVAAAGRPPLTVSSQATEPEERQRYLAELTALNYWSVVRRDRPMFARSTISKLGAAYTLEPMDFDELRGLVEHHMNGSGATNAWNDIVAALPPQHRQRAAAAYPKPPVFTRHSLLPPVVPPPRPEPGLPAIAKPSKVLEAMRQQQKHGGTGSADGAAAPGQGGQPAGVLAESSGGGAVWPWVLLGLAGAAGVWVWLRQRS